MVVMEVLESVSYFTRKFWPVFDDSINDSIESEDNNRPLPALV